MRVVFYAPSRGRYGGVKKTYQVAEGLYRLGHHVVVWAPDGVPDWFRVDVPATSQAPARADVLVVSPKWPDVALPHPHRRVCYVGGRRDDVHYDPRRSAIDLNICVSRWVAAHYASAGCPWCVIPLGFPTERFRFVPAAEKTGGTLAFMPRKNGSLVGPLIDAISAKRPACLPRLLPMDGMTEDEVIQAMGMASVFLAISTWDGFPLPPMEAMLCGALVVGFSAGGGAEYMQPNINWLAVEGPVTPTPEFAPGTISAFASQVVRALASPEAEMRAAARAIADSFTLAREASAWSVALERLLGRAAEPRGIADHQSATD